MDQKSQKLDYFPCFFERAQLGRESLSQSVAFLVVGVFLIFIFEIGLCIFHIQVNIFTAIYFVGGIGWIPATLCRLSHAYHRICQSTYYYLDIKDKVFFRKKRFNSAQELYNYSAELIFGYISNKLQIWIAILVWSFMIITIICCRGANTDQTIFQDFYMDIFYLVVGFVFTSVICAVIGFIISLVLLGRCLSSKHALYKGIVEQLREDRHYWLILNWCIVPLFIALAVAMGLSPYGTSLWLWLPFLCPFPILLFILCHSTTKKLMQTALKAEDRKWIRLTEEMIQLADEGCQCTTPSFGNCNYVSCFKRITFVGLHSVLGIRGYYQKYIQDKRSPTEWLLFLFTLLGATGSVLGATYEIWTDEWLLFFDMLKKVF